jgi:hypothetical protein
MLRTECSCTLITHWNIFTPAPIYPLLLASTQLIHRRGHNNNFSSLWIGLFLSLVYCTVLYSCSLINYRLYPYSRGAAHRRRNLGNTVLNVWCPSCHSFCLVSTVVSFLQYWYNIRPWWRADTPAAALVNSCCCAVPLLYSSWIFLGWNREGVPGGKWTRNRKCLTIARRSDHLAAL